MASEYTGYDIAQYLQGVEYPADKESLVSAARDNGAPQDFIENLLRLDEAVGLGERAEFAGPREVLEALGRLEPPTGPVAEAF